jgi:23S rRNA (guanosine2251-2'-O)-methyltransferase
MAKPHRPPRHAPSSAPRRGPPGQGPLRLYGRHPVTAALANPARQLRRLYATSRAQEALPALDIELTTVDERQLDQMVPADAPHQGLVLECAPLDPAALEDVLASARGRPLVMLDQVTDPHNLGAILRSAAAFGAAAVITQDRHSPPETGALAKAASGTLELIPWVRATNLSRALEMIAEADYWCIGLAGEASLTLDQALGSPRICLVLGAEGAGLRPNVADHCDALARLPISPVVESLNVSTAAAVALYATACAARG